MPRSQSLSESTDARNRHRLNAILIERVDTFIDSLTVSLVHLKSVHQQSPNDYTANQIISQEWYIKGLQLFKGSLRLNRNWCVPPDLEMDASTQEAYD